MTRSLATLIAALGLAAGTAHAGTDFGTDDDARSIASAMKAVISDGGVDAAIAAMHDPAHPFSGSQLGIHVFVDSIIVADNREPELIASSYAEVQDLLEKPMWPRIIEAANTDSDAMLKWYHYDTEEVYDYHCYSTWAEADSVLVMVCR